MLKMKQRLFILHNFEEIIAGAALVVTICTIIFNVIMRYLFNSSFNWAEEIATICFAWVVFIGAAACYKRGMHVGIDVLVVILPDRLRIMTESLVKAALPVLLGYLSYLSLIFSISAWEKPTAVLLIPYTWVDISAFIGFFLMFLYSLKDLKNMVRDRMRKREEG
jgi:TRAP-type transport system small permease protein